LKGWLAALLAILVTLVLIVTEITNAGLRSWWGGHSMTTDTVSGLLVLLITVLVVNQLLNQRQARQRSRAVAAQTAIMVAQAVQSDRALLSLIEGSDDRHAASDGFRTFMMMLLISAPVFIDDPVGRRFLEQAQVLGGVMAHTLEQMKKSTDGAAVSSDRLNDAMQQLQSAAAPLLHQLSPGVRDSVQGIGQTTEE
jgi:4-amino-4-deoxy-L-arabinose transferase-like glycosyltransferase